MAQTELLDGSPPLKPRYIPCGKYGALSNQNRVLAQGCYYSKDEYGAEREQIFRPLYVCMYVGMHMHMYMYMYMHESTWTTGS